MERVDFYIVESESPDTCEAVACQLAEKAWHSGIRVFLRTRDSAQCERMDKALWTYRQDSFLPHGTLAETTADPILLGAADQAPPDQRPMLINLAPGVAQNAESYQRIAEVACRDPAQLSAARSRFRWYRDRGITPDNHAIPTPRNPGR